MPEGPAGPRLRGPRSEPRGRGSGPGAIQGRDSGPRPRAWGPAPGPGLRPAAPGPRPQLFPLLRGASTKNALQINFFHEKMFHNILEVPKIALRTNIFAGGLGGVGAGGAGPERKIDSGTQHVTRNLFFFITKNWTQGPDPEPRAQGLGPGPRAPPRASGPVPGIPRPPSNNYPMEHI